MPRRRKFYRRRRRQRGIQRRRLHRRRVARNPFRRSKYRRERFASTFTFHGTPVDATTGSFQTGNIYFMFSSCPAYAGYAALFREYRIRRIAVTVAPVVATSLPAGPYQIALTQATDGAFITPNAIDDFGSDPSSLLVDIPPYALHPVRFSFVPSVICSVYDGASASANVKKYQWISTSDTNVRHYGYTYGFNFPGTGATGGKCFIKYKMWVEFRGLTNTN